MNKYLNMVKTNPKVKIAAIIIAVILVILIFLWIYKKVKKNGQNITDYFHNKELAMSANAEIDSESITLTQFQINSLANKLYTAMKGAGTDEEAIFSAFNALNSRSDLLQLIKTFGYKDGETLQEWLNGDLSTADISHINEILASKNINYIF